MLKISRPTNGQVCGMVLTPSAVDLSGGQAISDMRTVAGAVLMLRGQSGNEYTLTATLVNPTQLSVVVTSAPITPGTMDKDESTMQVKGFYQLWAVATLTSGAIIKCDRTPLHFRIVEDWETKQ